MKQKESIILFKTLLAKLQDIFYGYWVQLQKVVLAFYIYFSNSANFWLAFKKNIDSC